MWWTVKRTVKTRYMQWTVRTSLKSVNAVDCENSMDCENSVDAVDCENSVDAVDSENEPKVSKCGGL